VLSGCLSSLPCGAQLVSVRIHRPQPPTPPAEVEGLIATTWPAKGSGGGSPQRSAAVPSPAASPSDSRLLIQKLAYEDMVDYAAAAAAVPEPEMPDNASGVALGPVSAMAPHLVVVRSVPGIRM
jgi:hypothetical protein